MQKSWLLLVCSLSLFNVSTSANPIKRFLKGARRWHYEKAQSFEEKLGVITGRSAAIITGATLAWAAYKNSTAAKFADTEFLKKLMPGLFGLFMIYKGIDPIDTDENNDSSIKENIGLVNDTLQLLS